MTTETVCGTLFFVDSIQRKGCIFMQKTQLKGVFMLLLTAFIWGSSFVAQGMGMEQVQAFTFNGIRTLLGAAVLLPVIAAGEIRKNKKAPVSKEVKKAENKKVLKKGTVLGIMLCVAGNLQQFAFNWTSAGKIAFITAFYMLFVPVLGLFLKKKVALPTWLCIVAGVVGLYFLCICGKGLSGINFGDFLAFLCSIAFAVHILTVERFAGDVDSVKLSCVQFAVAGSVTCILMFIFEEPTAAALKASAVPIMYSGFLSCGVAYTLQIVGQKYTESTVASLLMCMESVFGVVCSAIIIKEKMTAWEVLGCVIMFVAIIVSQINFKTLFAHRKAARL